MPETIKYSEEELVQLLQSGDQSAFEYLYDHYSGALNTVILKLISDQQLAEDILQEAFVKIWNNFSTYESSKGRLFTWMLNITRNLTIDTIRSKSFKKQAKIQKTENAVTYTSSNINENDKFDALGIRKQTMLLKEDQKRVIDLAYFEGLTQEEISKKLDIPLGTVKTRMRTAISVLKKILQA
ncbi:MAG: sigma-70 family RNA polymerase sigma factor [Bacteroidota bacterium]|nr:sigma-70 family RNA polymerase sigma factor [Bacteroidota bacterium]